MRKFSARLTSEFVARPTRLAVVQQVQSIGMTKK
jgi:hypothetical protein